MSVRLLFLQAAYLALSVTAAQSQTLLPPYQKYEGKQVAAVQFDPPHQPLDLSELNAILPLKTGQPLRISDVRASIERLFATGCYADIQVDAALSGNAVIVRFITQNSWFIGSVSAKGEMSTPNAAQLETVTRLELGQPYTEAKLRQAVSEQQHLLESNGLYNSRIHPVFDYDSTYQQVHIRFEIDSGPRARFTTPVLRGNLQLDLKKILSATKWRRWLVHSWKPVTEVRVRQGLDGVRKLYEKNNLFEAKVSLESMDHDPEANTAAPTLSIDAGPRIRLRAVGAKISQGDLRRLVPVFEEHAVDTDLLAEGARNIRDYLQTKSYFDAEVQVEQRPPTDGGASIDYLIDRRGAHKLVRIEISGNRYFATETIRERMFLQTASLLQYPHGRYSADFLRRDEESIATLYRSNGFRDVRVSHRIEDGYRGKPGDTAVFLTVEEGPQYFVHSLQVDGIEQADSQQIYSLLSSVAGQPFSEFTVAVDRDAILGLYFAKGFANATFEWSSTPAAEPTRVDLRYVIHEGNAQTVRQVLISGLQTTNPALVRHSLDLNAGAPLSPAAIAATQRRLYDLGVFARVDTAIQNPEGETDSKYVLYEMDEANLYTITTGFGAEVARIGGCQTCLDAPAGATGFAPRVSFDLTRGNLWGLAHEISLRTRVSTLDQRALLTYTWPRFRNRPKWNVSFNTLFENSRDIRTFSFQRAEGSAQLSQKASKSTTIFYRYTYRRVSIDQATLKISPELIPLLSQPVGLGLVSVSLVQDRRDDPVDPHKGVYTTLDLGWADGVFGSERNFLRFLGRNSSYHPLGKKVVLARSTEFGDIYAFHYHGNPEDAVPLPERFFGGGASSQRGFPDNQSGPRDPLTGFPIGGDALLFNQTELRFPLRGDNIGGVLFHDCGNTYSSLGNLSFRVNQHDLQDFDYMVHAVGFGLRYRTPVGPLRLDLAYSINPPEFFGFKGTEQDLINAGVNPCAGASSKCVQQDVSHLQFFFSIGQTF
jgi:outer membrane protein insertion porin family